MPYYEVLAEETNGVTTAYDYGIGRISAITSDFWYNIKTAYVYDGRGSVAQTLVSDISWYTINGLFAPAFVASKSYTPFGEQLGDKVSGYGYNGEYYDAATGMVNLRARQYEPAMMRFMQKDTYTGNMYEPWTQNLYAYCANDPVNYVDPSGHSFVLDQFKKNIDKYKKDKEREEKQKASGIYKTVPKASLPSIKSAYIETIVEYSAKQIKKEKEKSVFDRIGDYIEAVYKEEARQLKIRADKYGIQAPMIYGQIQYITGRIIYQLVGMGNWLIVLKA